MPLIIIFFIIIPQQREMNKAVIMKLKRRKGEFAMTNEVLKKYIGKQCKISTGSFGTNITGRIIDVNENWIEIEAKKGNELINAEYVQSIKVLS
jgi:hypothetical protein